MPDLRVRIFDGVGPLVSFRSPPSHHVAQAVISIGEPVDTLDIDTVVVKASSGVQFMSTPGYPAGIDLRVKRLNVRNVHSVVDAPSRLVWVDVGYTAD